MAWTTPVAVFFICIVLMLVGMTVWEIKSPTTDAQGLSADGTTRGDRLFIGLLAAAYINLAFVGISGNLAEMAVAGDRARRSGSAFVLSMVCSL
jgi:predicted small integral membrane protein